MTRRFLSLGPLPALLLAACFSGGPGEHDHDHDHGPGAGGGEGDHAWDASRELHLDSALAEAWEIEVGPVGRTTLAAEITLPGVLGANENRTARIAPLVAGQIAELRVDLGSRVVAGQTLVSLNAPEFTRAQTDFLQAFTQAELSRKDYERALALRERQALEEREFLRRQSLHEQHLTELRAAEAILRALGVGDDRLEELRAGAGAPAGRGGWGGVDPLLPLRTPLAGVVLERDAVLGDHLEPGRTLFVVSDLSVLWAHLDAYEHHLPYLDPAAEVAVSTPLLPGRACPGRITMIADQVDPVLRTVRVRVEVDNRDGALKPNMFVQGLLRSRGGGRERLVVPEEAVQLLEGRHVVFVEAPPEPGEEHRVFHPREVVPGETLTEGRTIERGLTGGERVVLRGAFALKAELTRGVGGDPHVH